MIATPAISDTGTAEAIRLIVWDLDETFWRGTLTEGGIKEYVRMHHDLIITLANRGILSSICSKNDHHQVEAYLREQGIWDYFVFPSINWEPKGPRLRSLVENTGLRAPTVLFIDDNHGNRAEAAACVPGIQVADATRITSLLDDPSCKGKNDSSLSRLKQYRLLETRHREMRQSGGDNAEFLRASDIRVTVDFDIRAHIDRAVELINRTNQLNFTKRRLPEDPAVAARQLLSEIDHFWVTCGLVRVTDKYGDYGICGIYVQSRERLMHFCFSCRTLGMQIERWLFQKLGCPEIRVVGEVLTDLADSTVIDWINVATPRGCGCAHSAPAVKIPEIRIHGGCEVQPLAHYLRLHADSLSIRANYGKGALFVRNDSSASLFIELYGPTPGMDLAIRDLGLTVDDLRTSLLDPMPSGSLLVLCLGSEVFLETYWHSKLGFPVVVQFPALKGLSPHRIRESDVDAAIEAGQLRPDLRQSVLGSVEALRREYSYGGILTPQQVQESMARLIARIPPGSRALFLLPSEVASKDGSLIRRTSIAALNEQLIARFRGSESVHFMKFNDFVKNADEVDVYGHHFDRMVYFRAYEAIMALAAAAAAQQSKQ